MKRAVLLIGLGVFLAVAQVPAGAQDWQTPFQDTGTWTPVAMPTDGDMSLAQTFAVTQGLQGVGIQSPTWNGTGAGYRLRVFAWNTDYATSVAGTVLGEKIETDHADNSWTYLVLDTVLAPGQYLAVTDQPVVGTGNVGHWAWGESSAAGSAVPAAYSNGSLMAGFEFSFAVAEAEYTGGEGEGEGEGELVLTFDCGADGFAPANGVALTDSIGSLTCVPISGDPYMTRSTAIDGTTYQELAFQLNVANAASNDFPAAFFWFANGGHGRAGFQLAGDGDYTVRMNVPAAKDSGAANWDASVSTIRLDFPDGDATAFINAGTLFTLDWLSITADANYVPAATDTDSLDCDNDGVSNGYEALLGTNPFDADSDDDGVNDGIELQNGTDPLDDQSTPVVPVSSGIGLAAAALALAMAGLVLVRRRRMA